MSASSCPFPGFEWKQPPSEVCGALVFEGNIAVGKTFMIQKLIQILPQYGFRVMPTVKEELDEVMWKKFNSDMKRYALDFQRAMATRRISGLTTASVHASDGIVPVDTGAMREFAFTNAVCNESLITPLERRDHIEWFKTQVDAVRPRWTVLLRSSPETCFENCKRRNNGNEKELPLSHFTHVDQCHQDVYADDELNEWVATEQVFKLETNLFVDPLEVIKKVFCKPITA